MATFFSDLIAQFAHPVTAIAQILGFVCVIMSFLIFRNISRKASLTIKITSDFISGIHFFLLQQWTGGVLNFLNIFRGLCFYQRGQKKWAEGKWLPALFAVITIVGSILGWTGPESLLPMTGSCIIVLGFWNTDTRYLRRYNFVGVFLWMIYGIFSLSVSTILGNALAMISITITEVRILRQQKKNKAS